MASPSDLAFGPPRPDELDTMNALLEQALTFGVGGMAPWTQAIGHDNMRVVRRAGRVVAGIGVIPFGHWLGGRAVPAGGVTAVGVAPDQRGSGVGLWMLRRTLEEQRALGLPIATLYPATTAFYRRSGFERAATRGLYDVPLASIALRAPLETAPVEQGDFSAIRSLYDRRAARSAMFIDRPLPWWEVMRRQSDKPAYTFVALRDGQPEGYVTFMHAVWGETLQVRDIIALTPDAGRSLLKVLADHRSMLETVRLPAGPADPLLFLLPEQSPKVYRLFDLMLRILDVPAALTARGYSPAARAELHLDVADEILPDAAGRFVLRVADGAAQVERGGQGRIRLHTRDLAALYTGYLTPDELRLGGGLVASDADVAAAAQVFAGPRPWLPDMF